MAEVYMVRQLRAEPQGIVYQVTKFDGENHPKDSYNVLWHFTGNHTCDCMGFMRVKLTPEGRLEHKHVALVDAFRRDGEPPLSTWKLNPVRRVM